MRQVLLFLFCTLVAFSFVARADNYYYPRGVTHFVDSRGIIGYRTNILDDIVPSQMKCVLTGYTGSKTFNVTIVTNYYNPDVSDGATQDGVYHVIGSQTFHFFSHKEGSDSPIFNFIITPDDNGNSSFVGINCILSKTNA